jgi:hypothetical protein
MATTALPCRHRRAGSLFVGLLVIAGSLGGSTLASGGTTVSVDASVLVKAGLSPAAARQAATQLNTAIDSAARGIANAAKGSWPRGAPVRTTAATLARYTTEVDGALTQFVITAVPALVNGGMAAGAAVKGMGDVVGQLPGNLSRAAQLTVDATVRVGNGTEVSVDLGGQMDPSARGLVADTVRALQPLLPLTRSTLRAVATSVRQVVDALVLATKDIVRATVDATVTVLRSMRAMSEQSQQGTQRLLDSASTGLQTILAAVQGVLNNPQGNDLSVQVDASLHIGS